MPTITGKQLGQLRPLSTDPESIYSPPANIRTDIKAILICNVTSSPSEWSLYHDEDGSIYDQNSSLFLDQPIAAKTTVLIEIAGEGFSMNNSSGNFAVQTNIIGSVNFTLYGSEISCL